MTTVPEEFARLSILAQYKYDSYRDFVAGARFIEKFAKASAV